MQILMVGESSLSARRGGLNRYFGDLRSALAASGLRVKAATFGDDLKGSNPDWTVLGDARSSLAVRFRQLLKFGWTRNLDADLVDVHFALYAFPLLFTPLRKVPWVVHFHGPWAAEAEANGSRFGLAGRLRRAIERRVYAYAEICVTLSESFAVVLMKSYGVESSRIRVMRPSLSEAWTADAGRDLLAVRTKYGIPPEAFMCVTVRRLVPRTGVADLVSEWLSQSDLLSGVWLLIVGEGPERGKIEELLSVHSSEEKHGAVNVRVLGGLSDGEMRALVGAADLALVPTRSLEGFGLVVLESLAARTPVLATALGGLPEALGPFAQDMTIAEGRFDLWPTRIAQLAADPAKLPGPEECHGYASSFTPERLADEHLHVYRTLIKSGPR